MSHWSDTLVKLGACAPAVEWARKQPTYAEAWSRCTVPSWLRWLIWKASPKGIARLHRYTLALDIECEHRDRLGRIQYRCRAACDAIRAAIEHPSLPSIDGDREAA